MNMPGLTGPAGAAKNPIMGRFCNQSELPGPGARCARALLMASAMTLAGCISVSAPDKPIVIELNINIKQEVIYRLAADAENTIEENADIF